MSNTTRTSPEKAGEPKRFSARIDEFLRANRVVLFALLAVAVLGLAALAIVSGITSSRREASTLRVEKLAEDLGNWSSEQDATKKAEAEKALVAGLKEVTAKWPSQFAAARAWSMLARVAETNKDYAEAEKDWMAVYNGFKKTFIAPVALQNAAAAAEERGANEQAIADYKLVVDNYADSAVGVPHALFSLGRLAEDSKDYAAAVASYQKLVSTYPDDDWTKLAKDRIIFLKARGLSK